MINVFLSTLILQKPLLTLYDLKNPFRMNLGRTIRRLREYRNLTQEYMAAQLKMGPTAYGNIERNEVKRLTIERLMQIADVLGVHFSELFQEPPPPQHQRKLKPALQEKDLQDVLAYFRQDKLLMKEMMISLRDSVHKMDQLMSEHMRIMRSMLGPLRENSARRVAELKQKTD